MGDGGNGGYPNKAGSPGQSFTAPGSYGLSWTTHRSAGGGGPSGVLTLGSNGATGSPGAAGLAISGYSNLKIITNGTITGSTN